MLIRALSSWVCGVGLLSVAPLSSAQEERVRDPATDPASSARDLVPPEPLEAGVEYPEGATGDADVSVELTVDAQGRVRDVTVLGGASPFAEAARRSVESWRFQPATMQGKPVAARIRYVVRFKSIDEGAEPTTTTARGARPAQTPAAPNVGELPPSTPEEPIEVIVSGERRTLGAVTVSREEARALPGTFGDPLRAIEAQPGVVPVVSGLPAFFIRGAPPSNVGFFLDGVDLPLLYHAFLGPSVVHPALISSIEFYPGGAPVQYGRFAGPVIAVRTRPMEGQFHAEGALRAIDVGAFVEGPLFGCFDAARPACAGTGARIAGRYSYTGLILSLLSDSKLDYWDYLAEVKHAVGPNDSVGIFAFGGYDFFQAPQQSENSGGELTFHRIDARWDRHLGPRSLLRAAITAGYDRAAGAIEDSSVVTDRSLRGRVGLTHELGSRATLSAGADVRVDFFQLNTNPRYTSYPDYSTLFPQREDVVVGAYVGADFVPARGIHVSPGVRADVYRSMGETAIGVDPRIAAEFDVGGGVRLQHSLGVAHQRPNFAAQVPGAQVADLEGGLQLAVLWSSGVRAALPSDLSASASVYRTAYFNALDPIGGARDFTIDRTLLERRSTIAAAGLELRIERAMTRRLGGFLSYTLSRSEQSAGTLTTPSGFDRTHVVQGALGYDFGAGVRTGVRAVFYSGIPELSLQGQPHFSDERRGTPYFRMDVRAEKRWELGNGRHWSLIAEVLNATSTKEVVRLDCGEICRERQAGPVILPSVGIEVGL